MPGLEHACEKRKKIMKRSASAGGVYYTYHKQKDVKERKRRLKKMMKRNDGVPWELSMTHERHNIARRRFVQYEIFARRRSG